MPVYRIPDAPIFPPASHAEDSGLLGVGGDLSAERLLLAYRSGIFPWYSDAEPILWWSPDPRFVLSLGDLVVQRSLAKRIRQRPYRITLDQRFSDVLAHCASTPRPGQAGTWLTDDMREAYERLHSLGYAHSVEAWRGDELVGGLYTIAVGGFLSGESMFAHAPDASKIAFVHLVRQLQRWGFTMMDCQVHTEHLERFGATHQPRAAYLAEVATLCAQPGRPGPWAFDPHFVCLG